MILINGKVVMNSVYSLNAGAAISGACSNTRFPARCVMRNRIKNRPVSDIQYFFAKDDLSSADLAAILSCLFSQDKCKSEKFLALLTYR